MTTAAYFRYLLPTLFGNPMPPYRSSILVTVWVLLVFGCTSIKQRIEETHENGASKVVASYDGDRKIDESTYYPNGQVQMRGGFDKDGERHGPWKSWYDNGNVWSESEFSNGKRHGVNTVYYQNGKKRYQGQFDNDEESGNWVFWDELGNVQKEQEF